MERTFITAKQMQLGDVIKIKNSDAPFSTSIVKQIKDGMVTIFRPYGTTADFSYTGGVIPYIGIEEYDIFPSSNEYELLERKTLNI